ncbi:MAG: PPK2 family polyphosphate kinase [Myxococcota bacterium]
MGKKKQRIDPAPVESPYLVPFDESWKLRKASTKPPKKAPQGKKGKGENKAALAECVKEIYELQRKLFAEDKFSLLLVFQAMDAAGKDGTIRAVMTGINPAGCQVSSFKRPSSEELDHDFLWRIGQRMPERGRIGIFNRSHYEEVLVVRVNPGILKSQRLPSISDHIWDERYASIRNFEEHAARNGTVVRKFFLNVSKGEQKDRLLARIDDERKNWKFEAGDLDARDQWDDYMKAYEKALNETSRPWAPWYAIPADDKPFMRRTVADIVRRTLESMPIAFPTLNREQQAKLQEHRKRLEAS